MTKSEKWEVLHSTGTNTWKTPQEFYDRINKEFHFNLDPTCTLSSRKCGMYITPEQDCLKIKWQDYVQGTIGQNCVAYMNPPFGLPEHPCKKVCKKKTCEKRGFHVDRYIPGQVDFVHKAAEEATRGGTVVALLPARTDTGLFHEYILGHQNVEVRFLQGRLTFEVDGPAEGAPKADCCPFPLMLVIFHPWGMNHEPRPFEVKSMKAEE